MIGTWPPIKSVIPGPPLVGNVHEIDPRAVLEEPPVMCCAVPGPAEA